MDAVLDVFKKWDSDGNGKIDPCELRKVLLGMGLEERSLPTIFRLVDKNNDDQIDIGEFIEWIYSDQTPTQVVEHVNALVLRIANALSMSKVAPETFFAKVDIDCDKRLSFSEFARVCRQFEASICDLDLLKAFTHFDVNNSGWIDAQEFRARLEQALSRKDHGKRPASAQAQRPISATGHREPHMHAVQRPVSQGDARTRIERPELVVEFRAITKNDDLIGRLGGPVASVSNMPANMHMQAHPDCYNAGFVWDHGLQAKSDWRGPLAAPRESEAYKWASQVVDAAFSLARVARHADNVWLPHGEALAQLLGTRDRNKQEQIASFLASECLKVVRQETTLARVTAPVKVFGDVHGHLRDLLALFDSYVFPSHRAGDVETMSYIFNGDWVDRGTHQLETVVLLFALKVLYPSRIFLVRGNHEFRQQNEDQGKSGFHSAVAQHFGQGNACYQQCHNVFDWLPLGALIQDVALVVHGGIGDGGWTLADLEFGVQRPLQDCFSGVPNFVTQVLWSDPTDSDDFMNRGVHMNRQRGGAGRIQQFGPDVTREFCRREGLQMIIRSHQWAMEGVKYLHGGRLVTVFSARNYLPSIQNDCALLLVAYDADGKLRVRAKSLEHIKEA